MLNKKQLLIISLFVCFILSLSFVSASNHVDNLNLSSSDNQNNLQTIEVVKLQQTNDRGVLSAKDDGTFKALDAKINDPNLNDGDTVYLENNYSYVSADGDALKNGIFFTKNIIIDGKGFTINGSNVARIFDVGNNIANSHPGVSNVTLRNINFVNAYSSDSSASTSFAAVEFIGNGKIENCNFSYNRAGSAAALLIGWATDFNITNCQFTFNSANNNGGGAIRLRTGVDSIRIIDSKFINNTAPTQAGAVHFSSGAGNQNISVINCDFINNSANSGGALLFQCPNGTVKDSRFNNNKAIDTHGGAIYWDGSYGNVINSNFTNNNATSGGGAIYSTGASPSITLSKFDYNNASEGGAIYFSGTTNGIITNSTFNHNNATSNGGAVYVSGTLFTLIDVNFTNNKASYGGSIYLDIGAYINHCLFDRETATTDGGSIYLNTISVTDPSLLAAYRDKLGIFNSTISNCNAGHDGGAGYVRVSYGVVRNTTFINNFAGNDGGAGYVYGNYGTLIDSRFISNRAVNKGGAVMWIGFNGTADHVNFTSNHAVGPNGQGGSIVWQGVNGTIDNCRFNISTAKMNGGAVYIAGNNTKIKYSDFQRYNATGSGGAIYVEGNRVNITDDAFSYGEAHYGGAIYINGNETRIIDINLTRNHATVDGGVIYVEGTDAKIIRTNITFSYSEHSGGAIYIKGNDTLVKDSNFTYTNASSANGGAIYVNGDDTDITNSKFSLNYAINGGAIYIEGSNANVTGSDFSQNGVNPTQIGSTGDTKGGSIYIAGDGTVIDKSNFTQSNAGNGGILYISGNNANITQSKFKFSLAVANGGAIYVGGINASILSSSFQFTNATNGGAIYLAGSQTNIDANFSYCFAKNGNGGAIYVFGDNNNITNANFTITNAIGGNGGAVYAGGANTTLVNCHSNIANAIQTHPGTGNGGAVYISGDKAKISTSVFNFYNATGTGGALYVAGNNLNISRSGFEYGESNMGGAIYINGNKTHVEHSNLTHNHANTNGGIIYINGNNATITDSNLKYSYALASGGAVFINGKENIIKNSNLSYNNASGGFGGSIYINGDYNNITDCNFSAMTSSKSGGAIYITGANTTISDSDFTGTVAYSGDGGAIYISGLNTTVKHSTFEDISIDDGDGGAIYIDGNRAKVDYCNFTRISSPNNKGGTVCVAGNYSEILNSNMVNCSAFTNGGAVYIVGHNATVSADFENCEATGYIHYKSLDYYVPSYGGAIYIEGHDNNVTQSSFNNCTVHYKTTDAISAGGAIYIMGERNTIEYSTFTQDVSEVSIGADIYVKGNDNNITHSSFDNSKASSGGSIYVEGDKFYIHNSTFEICRAPGNGGAIYLSGDNGTIDNCTLEGTYSNSNGGAIYISGHNDTVSNSHFKRNDQRGTVVVQYGGAIYMEGDFGKVINSTFNHTGAINDGGVIYVAGNNVTVDNSNFTNASANNGGVIYVAGDYATLNKLLCENSNSTKDGGALYILGEHCELQNSTFKKNIALDDGGAINWKGDFGTIYNITCEDNKGISGGTSHSKGGTISLTANDMSVNKTKITNSFVSYNGGAMFVTGNDVNITESDFKNCRVNITLNADGDDLPYGGALYILGNYTNVVDCTFDDCRAKEGGIIFVQGHDVTIDNATCTNSNATSNGGAFYILGENAIISNSHVTDSNATVSGGAIYITGEYANITGSSFNLTNAFGHTSDGGGAIFVEGNNAVISSSNFTDTFANFNNKAIGGAIYVEGHGVNITESNFNRTGANLYGGAIYIDGENTTVKGSNFTNCSVDNGYGGAIYIKGYNTTVATSSFKNNNASISGGAIYVNGLLTSIIDSNFTYNYATTGGGAIYLINCHNTTINGSTFKNNNATKGLGGAVRFDIGTLYCVIDSSNFENNHASNDGGAVFWGESNYGRILNSNFTNNSASSTTAAPGGNGGAVYWSNAIGGYINNSRFIDNFVVYKSGVTNTFKAQGGAIFWTGNQGLIENSYFKGNNASSGQDRRGGGAIGLAKEMGDLLARNTVINNCTFEENYSPHGGAICSELCQNTTIKNSHFNNNTAGTGGAIYIENARNVTIINTTFDGNHAKEGGAYYGNQFYNYNITMDRCNFTNNSAQYGAAIKIKRVFGLEITNARFEDNLANDSDRNVGGGAISINEVQNDQSSTMKLINITFINCTTKSSGNGYGGALQLRTNASVLENINFTDCYAVYGGSIALYGCTNTTFKNININGSEATSGGSIYLEGSSIAFANATIYDSYAKSNGGSIYVHGSNSNIYNIIIRKTESKGNGGSIYVEGGNTNIHHINITDSMSSGAGGSISWGGYNGTLNFVNINNSHSNGGGGAVYWTGGSGKLYNTTINNNIYANDGGAIYWTGNYGTVFNVTINDTRSNGYGGAIYWQGNNGNLTKVYINNSESAKSAGAIYFKNSASSTVLNNVEIVNSVAKGTSNYARGGGGIYIDCTSSLVMNNVKMDNVSAQWGGALYILGNNENTGSKNNFTNFTIHLSKATEYGGAIYITDDNKNGGVAANNVLVNFTITNASAKDGGAVYVKASNVNNCKDNKLLNSTIANCTATNYGGAVYWKASDGMIDNLTCINNTAKYGGAIYADTYSLTINNSNFTLNKAERGSAIYTNVALSITNTSFIKNRANSASLDIEVNSANTQVTITFKGWDNLLNAIYVTSTSTQISVNNVTYWDYAGVAKTATESLTATTVSSMVEAGQNITIGIYDLDNNELYYGNKILTDVNGQITINLGSFTSSRRLTASRFAEMLRASGPINVYAFLTNEDYYTYIENSRGTKAISHIVASADNIDYHQNTTINVSMVEPATGIVSIYINETFYDNITLNSEYKGSLINVTTLKWSKFLPAGKYEVLAKYWGDDNYMPSRTTTTFVVDKLPTNITIDVDDKGYSLYINLTVFNDDILDVTGNVTLEIDGRTFTVDINNSKGFIVVDNIVPGTYTINAIYNGDSNYLNSTNSTDFTMVRKDPASIILNVSDIMINETESINVTVNVNGTGNLTIYVNGKPYNVTLNESKAQLNVTGLPKGTNYVLVIYDGDKNLTGGRVEDTFLVSKYNPTININTTNITAGSVEKLNITLPKDAEGIIKVNINGTKYYGEIENGEVIINVTGLKVGVYNVTVYFFEDGKYLSGNNSTLFKVSVATPIISVAVDNVTYGNQTIVKVVLPSDANGTITININDTYKLENVELVNGTYTWTVPGILASDNYTASVTYSGNAKYAANTNSTDFEVYRATPTITIEAVVVDADTNATVIVHITPGTTGDINITVNNKNYSGPINSGIARITIDKLPADKYDIVANYSGDKNFTNALTTLTDGLNVVKVTDYKMNITAGDINVGNYTKIIVKVPTDATGNVIINLNGTNYTVAINQGIANLTNISTLDAGIYNVTAYFGNSKYENKTAETRFVVSKVETPISIDVDPIKVGDKAVITVTAPKDILNNISIEIDGVKYNKTVDAATGVAVFEVQIWSNGTRTVVATYDGDRKYLFNSTTAQFDVTKRVSQLNVTAVGGEVGGNATVSVEVQDNATGYVTLNINGTNYTVNLTGGKGSVNITGLGNGTYYVHATYLGDRQYLTSTNNSKTFVMSKVSPVITINVGNVTYGNHTVIVVSVPGASGNITIKINTTDKGEFTLTNGKVELDAGILAVDNYTVHVTYKGDDKYATGNADNDFNVSRATPTITIESVEVDADKNATVIVHITPGTTGNINITVNGKNYSGPIDNGVARIVIDKLPVDTYNIFANYTGDKNFTNASTTLTDGLNVVKVSDYLINVTAGDIKVDDLTNITVNVPIDAVGKVIVEIEGVNYTAAISHGKAVFNNDTGLGEGKYNITAYFGNGKYANKTATGVFYITKVETPIGIDVDPIKVGDKAVITVTVPKDVINNVTIEIDGVKYNKSVDAATGVAVFEVQIWSNGTRTVAVTYGGDRKYLFNSTTAQFGVTKRVSQLNVTAVGGDVGGNATVSVEVQDNATGYVTLNINGTNYTVNLTGGKGSVNITGLGNGTYYVHATYLGDRQYLTSTNNSKTFVMSKVSPVITINVGNVTYGNHTVIVVSVPGASGNITIKINTTDKGEFTLTNGKVELDAGILAVDNYTVHVTYKGDDKYATGNADNDFNVSRATPTITIESVEVDADKNATVIVHITPGTTGNINITVNGKNYSGPIDNGVARIVIDKLPVDTYNIFANYTGDKNFTNASTTLTDGLNVVKVSDYLINVTAGDIKVGNLTDIVVNVPSDASGKVIVNINGTNYTAVISQGKAVFNNDTGLGEGKYNITAYFGNGKYANKTVDGVFYITKVETPISIDVNDGLVGDVTKVVVTVPDDVDNIVTIEVNGRTFTNTTVNGNATFYIKDLTYGNKTVTATYAGDKKYMFNSTTANFTVDKRKSQVNVTVNATTVGNDVEINVTIPANATGYVIVNINGTNYTVNTTNGNGTLIIKGLAGGHCTVNLTYIGDEQYFPSTNATAFNIRKVASDVSVSADNITVGEKAIITVKVPADATGNVTTVIVGGKTYYVSVSNGTGILVVPGLKVGNYTVKVVYNGDGKYFSSAENETKFSVNKVNVTEPDIKVIDQGNGTVVVVVPGNATGNVTIKVGNDTYNATVINGTAIVNLTNATPGKHNITVIYSGDGNHTNVTTTANVTIPKLAPAVKIDVGDIYVGDVALINITLPVDATGTVTIEINGKVYTPVEFRNGVARFEVDDLVFGNKTVAVKYSGDANYTAINGTANFTVKKRASQVNVTANASIVGKDAIINVTIPDDARGYVIVNVDTTAYVINMTSAKGSITIRGLANGTHKVDVTYLGNDKYLSSTNGTSFSISKVASDVSVSADNITVGEKAIITVKVPADATGNVTTVIVGGKTYYVSVSNGTGILVVPGLKVGNYTVKVVYNGDGKYFSSAENETKFSVNKVNVTEPDIKVIDQGNGTVVVVVPGNATGNVTVTVEGQNYTANVTNGTAVITLTNATPGIHNITVIYSGDGNYTNVTTNATANIPKYETPITVNITDIKEGETAVINITVPVNATGNVTVIIGGHKYSGEIVNGNVTVKVENLTAGDKTVVVEYPGDSNYTANYTVGNFTVGKAKVVPDIVVVDQGNGTVVVVVGGNATGNVTITVDGQNFTGNVTNGTAVITLTNVTPGVHNITVIYSGDGNYTNVTTTADVSVPKYETPITVNVTEVKEGETAVVTVTVPVNATGNVTVTIDGKEYTAEIIGGNATVEIENITAGPKTIIVEYPGDSNYTANYTIGNFTVEKAKVVPDIVVVDLGNNTVVVVVGGNATGNVTITVEGQNYTADVINGTAVVTLTNVTPGVHNITVIYSGDDTYANATVNATVDAAKYDAPINVTVSEAKEGETTTITVNVPQNATGNVTITIDGKEYAGEIKDGEAIIKVDNLTAGDKTVVVEYPGDSNYTANYTLGNFTVEKAKVVPDIVVVDQGNGTVVVVVGDNATGNVTITVGGENFTGEVINGTAVITVDNLIPGNNTAEVFYSGDDKHTNSTVNTIINGLQYDTPINVTVSEVKEGENATVTITVPENATGNVTVTIDGQKYTAEIINGIATVEIENLTAGPKTVLVEYGGDDNYTSNYTTKDFTVEKTKQTSEIYVVDQGNGTVVVVVPNNATGNVTITVGGENFTGEVINGTAVISVDNLVPGNNTVEIMYSGDDTHTAVAVNATINGIKYDAPINVTVNEVKEGETAIITVEVPVNATGNVTVTIDGKEYSGEINGGLVTVKVENITAGDKSVIVEYLGDDNYAANYTISNFTVEKAKTTPDINVVDLGNGTVVVVVGPNATGNVTITVDGQNFTADVINGTAVVNLDNVVPGTYDVDVIYSGDDRYNNATKETIITIAEQPTKKDTPITVEVNDIYVGETAKVIVTVPENATGNITIEINGISQTQEIIGGKATFAIGGLAYGNKTVSVIYAGDDEYTHNATTAQFKVSKLNSRINVSVEDANVGENVTIIVYGPTDATGQVLIDIDGVGYYVNLTNGVGLIDIPRIPSGIYNVNLTYVGDDKYLGSSNVTVFNVSKVKSFVIPVAHDIYVGELETIRLTVPVDATGNVTLIIDGDEYHLDLDTGLLTAAYSEGDKYSVAISGGNGEIVISGLPKGEYTVSAKYNGDAKYLPAVNATTFKVLKSNTEMEVIDQGNGTVIVKLPENATGNVTIKLGNETYVADVVNGTAVITLDNATPGKHEIEVIYSGDDNYLPETTNSTVEIPRYCTPISVSTHDIYVGETETVVVMLPEDATGKVTIEINGVEYTADVKDGKATFEVDGLAFGNKTVAVRYEGDDSYVENFTTGQFEVAKNPSTTKATSKDIKVGKDEVITVTVPGDATGRALVDINGIGYYADIINGKAKVIIPNLEAGKYKATVIYEGDDKYLPSNTTTSFKVVKSSTPISATGDEIEVGEDAVVVIDLPSDATGIVTIRIDGKTYATEVVDGRSVFVIPGLSVGIYLVDVYYSGDDNYPANSTVTFVVVNDSPDRNDTNHSVRAGVELSNYPTGNPLLIVLLALLSIGSIRIRRFRK